MLVSTFWLLSVLQYTVPKIFSGRIEIDLQLKKDNNTEQKAKIKVKIEVLCTSKWVKIYTSIHVICIYVHYTLGDVK